MIVHILLDLTVTRRPSAADFTESDLIGVVAQAFGGTFPKRMGLKHGKVAVVGNVPDDVSISLANFRVGVPKPAPQEVNGKHDAPQKLAAGVSESAKAAFLATPPAEIEKQVDQVFDGMKPRLGIVP